MTRPTTTGENVYTLRINGRCIHSTSEKTLEGAKELASLLVQKWCINGRMAVVTVLYQGDVVHINQTPKPIAQRSAIRTQYA